MSEQIVRDYPLRRKRGRPPYLPIVDPDEWRGPDQLVNSAPIYEPRSIGQLLECLEDLATFSASTWSNYEVLKRLDDLRDIVRRAIGPGHLVTRRMFSLRQVVIQERDAGRISDEIVRLMSIVSTLPKTMPLKIVRPRLKPRKRLYP